MKARHVMFLVTLGVLIAASGQRATAGGSGKVPIPTGQFSNTIEGTFAICVNATATAYESCSTKGALVLPFSYKGAGVSIRDSKGACASRTDISSPLPPSAQPPNIDSEFHSATTITDYDPSTGVGDQSFIDYDGGRCIGAKFDSNGATETGSGTEHFVVSQNGKRIDVVNTENTSTPDHFGSFNFAVVDLKQ